MKFTFLALLAIQKKVKFTFPTEIIRFLTPLNMSKSEIHVSDTNDYMSKSEIHVSDTNDYMSKSEIHVSSPLVMQFTVKFTFPTPIGNDTNKVNFTVLTPLTMSIQVKFVSDASTMVD